MGNPKFRVRASGMGGSGYARPPVPGEPFRMVTNADKEKIPAAMDAKEGDGGKPIIVPGVTTVVKSFGTPPGLVQWQIDQVVGYAVTHLDSLYNRSENQGFGFLRFYNKRTPDVSDPLRTAHDGVLSDLADIGTKMHDWSQAEVNGWMLPPSDSEVMDQMIDAWKQWRFTNSVKPLMTEVTVYGDGYAGTFDGLWYVNGVLTLLDEKTSRTIGDYHKMQLAALREACLHGDYYVREGSEWHPKRVPTPRQYGFIQMRPNDDEHAARQGAFVEFHTITEAELDLYYQKFQCALKVLQLDKQIKFLDNGPSVEVETEEKS